MDDEVISDLESTYLQDWSLQDNSWTDENDWRLSLWPTSDPFDEFAMDLEKDDYLFGPPFADDEMNASSFPLEKRFEVTRHNLEASMRRSQETRQSLTLNTSQVEQHTRQSCIKDVIESVEESAQKLQTCFVLAKIAPQLNSAHAKKA